MIDIKKLKKLKKLKIEKEFKFLNLKFKNF